MELGFTGKAPEVLQPVACAVSGALPPWLNGLTLFRNGPGQFDVELPSGGTFTVPHWFDGLTQLHAWEFGRGGGVSYRSRHLYPELEEYVKQHQTYPCFAGAGRGGVLSRLGTRLLQALRLAPPDGPRHEPSGRTRHNVGVTVGPVAGRLYSKTDANFLVEIDPASLLPGPPTSYTDLNPAFSGYLSAAHGQRDEARRECYNFVLDFPGGKPTYRVFAISDPPAGAGAAGAGAADGGAAAAAAEGGGGTSAPLGRVLATIEAPAAYIHSFAMTQNYLVLMVWPLLLSPAKLWLFGSPGRAMDWQPRQGTRFYVIDRREGGSGGHVATYSSEAFFCFHTINAWEEEQAGGGTALHIDLCAYEDAGWFEAFSLPHLRSGASKMPKVDIRRYTLPDLERALAAGPAACHAARRTTLADMTSPGGAHNYELPRINKAFAMRPHRYVYASAAAASDSAFLDSIAKVDLSSGATQLWHVPAHYPGEPIFCAAPDAQREDDGVLLSVVLAAPERHSYLLVLDAGTMAEVARADVGHAIKFGFHGNLVAPDGTSPTDLA